MEKYEKKLLRMKIVLGLLTAIILFLPWLFTQERYHILDFSHTGEIGDTIGGILSPFIAILVGYLTFEAFRMQYVANELHRSDTKEHDLKNQRERFDNRFYTMLEALRANSRSVQSYSQQGKSAYKALVAELFVTYYVTKEAFLRFLPNASDAVKAYLEANQANETIMLTRMAYGLFFYGELYHVDNGAEPLIAEILEGVKSLIRKNGEGDRAESFEIFLAKDINGGQLPTFATDMLGGHNDQLGHYFRHIYQMIKFLALADETIVDEEAKNEYVRIIRAELSDYEQVLLYYNAISDKQESWNKAIGQTEGNEYSQRGVLSRFRLIKNIPGNILYRGMDPWTYYIAEERWWKVKERDFFEQKYIMTAEDVFRPI